MAASIKYCGRPFRGGGLCLPSHKSGGLGGSAPQPKPKNFENNSKKSLGRKYLWDNLLRPVISSSSRICFYFELSSCHSFCRCQATSALDDRDSLGLPKFNNVSLKQYFFRRISRSNTASIFQFFEKILAGGRCPPDPPNFGWGGFAPPDPPLDGYWPGGCRPPDPPCFFFSPLTTGAPS